MTYLVDTNVISELLIAATAWAHDLTLATRNTPDFEDCGIRLLNPFSDA
ncbi:hypothetical protein [uncultured Thiodictyon sp.]|nr:hypothetical protein [uncultured Thiodictyon sp.]